MNLRSTDGSQLLQYSNNLLSQEPAFFDGTSPVAVDDDVQLDDFGTGTFKNLSLCRWRLNSRLDLELLSHANRLHPLYDEGANLAKVTSRHGLMGPGIEGRNSLSLKSRFFDCESQTKNIGARDSSIF